MNQDKEQPSSSQGGGTYPGKKEELDKFVGGILMSLHNDKTRPDILKQLTTEDVPVAVRIGNVVAQVITAMIERVMQQAKRKPLKQLIIKSIHMTVKEVSKMAELAGQEVTPEDRKQAAGIAGSIIEEGLAGGNNQGQQMQGQPLGQPDQQLPPEQPLDRQPGLLEQGSM